MSNELFLSASEVNLCVAGNQIEKGLVAACTGLKRFLNDASQSFEWRPPANAARAFSDALEEALVAAELDPIGARLLMAELRLALADERGQDEKGSASAKAATAPSVTAALRDPLAWQAHQLSAFQKAQELQAWVCALPELLDDKQRLKRVQPDVIRGLTCVGVALAAAGAVGYAATPAGIVALGGAGIAEGVKLVAGYVFGESVKQAHEKFKMVHESKGEPHSPCCRKGQ